MEKSAASVAFSNNLGLEVDVLNCKDLDPTAVVFEPVPPVIGDDSENGVGGVTKKTKVEPVEREIVLGRNIHTSCLDITEPEANDEMTGDKAAYMAAVLARYRQTLMERTKHHLGNASISQFRISLEDYVCFWRNVLI